MAIMLYNMYWVSAHTLTHTIEIFILKYCCKFIWIFI